MDLHDQHVILSETARYDRETGELRIVVETPKGSHNKYDYDPNFDCFELAAVLPEGISFPYDFGVIPSTFGNGGDPLDILLLGGRTWLSRVCRATPADRRGRGGAKAEEAENGSVTTG